ncbi:cupin domain-containing protein [Niabella drilacis]|uniref:Cupin domain protein n=1 Tax=Niabella drilacis (strain DSM 25811 / CCM 8410 / CCUG 62505 / LMG 26954 / E90) TaxID=1285928 RepID=A0A1G6WTT2_NIADE|nr:cupin domain-containing protein [Niabella drilacis]SDD69298.1 Cupin domain protein [Niabella drilacis]
MKCNYFISTVLGAIPLFTWLKTRGTNALQTTTGFKVPAGQARFGIHYKMKGVTLNMLDIKISGKDTNGGLAVFEQTSLTYKGGPPLHIHLNQDEWFYVLEGKYRFRVGDDLYDMAPGDTIFLPRRVPHAFIQLTEKARVIVSYCPAGSMEDFFAVTSQWTTPPTKETIAGVFADHEMKVVGPPLKAD